MTTAWRRSHRKSRDGCLICKQRRVKCDETRPQCITCQRRRVTCIYPSPTIETKSLSHISIDHISQRASPKAQDSPLPLSTITEPSTIEPEDGSFDTQDLKLMTHFHLEVCDSLDADKSSPLRWRDQLGKPAFDHPVVYHAVLALSAQHYARTANNEIFRQRATMHNMRATRCMIDALPRLDNSNADSLFYGSILMCIFITANGPQPGQYLAFTDGDNSDAQWIWLLKGVRSIIRSGFVHVIASFTPHESPSSEDESRYQQEYIRALRELTGLRSYAASIEDAATAVCLNTIDSLRSCYVNSFQGSSNIVAPYHASTWLYFLEPDYLTLLQTKHHLALIIFAYFDILLHHLRHFWQWNGWSRHILSGIKQHLHLAHHAMLQWPIEVVEAPLDDVEPG